jgi:hypothetical protein
MDLLRVVSLAVVVVGHWLVMTVFLWHMTAYFAVVVALAVLGTPMPSTPDATWWLERPLFLAIPAAALVPLVLVFASRLNGPLLRWRR